MTDKEPIIAATDKAISPITPNRLNATPPKLPLNRMTKATPMLAPELIPNTEGPANGLRNTVCICNPLTAKPAPAASAIKACGKRDFQIMFCQETGSFPVPVRIFQIDCAGIATEPNNKFSSSSTRISNRINNIR